MANVLIEESTMSSIADSIRGKTGGSEPMRPGEMAAEIDRISTGGNKPDPDLPIRFFSYDGELLYSFSLEQLAEMESLPPVPDVAGLISQGWNWTLQNLILNGREADVGPMYITDDGATRVYIELCGDRRSPYLGFRQSESYGVTIDWGDGSEIETSPNYGNNLVLLSHTYERTGSYIIKLTPSAGTVITLIGQSTSVRNGKLLSWGKEDASRNAIYTNTVRKIELGRNVAVSDCAFGYMGCLESITMPAYITDIGKRAFNNCNSLKLIVLPEGTLELAEYLAENCKGLRNISIPYSVRTGNSFLFTGCYSLEKAAFPNNMTQIGSNTFQDCKNLRRFRFPQEITVIPYSFFYGASALQKVIIDGVNAVEISGNAFNNCSSLGTIEIPETVEKIGANAFVNTRCKSLYAYPETPPEITNSNFLDGFVSQGFVIYVPNGSLSEYQTAAGWSNYSSYMRELPA